ncbi:hypothetical protein HPB49_003867 [Dermacentor silvarum]|uniref:Uncharacterized protein n=1 Tax=Dermacentor silvarum TaxID=543639 RepID=A0ACB8DTT1_DERSI|nr:uncharacterized protein LOC119434978 [Dermacentor silvarum]KAH7977895.1 hypothetical protein HPB49_003867 [Dermacentor silvarum]
MASTTTTIRTTVVGEGPTIKFVSVQQGFISTISGLLTSIEMVLGIIVFSLAMLWLTKGAVLFLVLISFAFWVMSFLILISSAFSATGTLLPTTLFYMVFHGTAFLFYLSGGVSTIISSHHGVTIAAGVLGLVASIFHLIHTGFAYKKKI